MSESFISHYGLTFKFDERELPYPFAPGPSIKINYVGIAKTGNLDKNTVTLALTSLFETIGECFTNHPYMELDLTVLGRMVSE